MIMYYYITSLSYNHMLHWQYSSFLHGRELPSMPWEHRSLMWRRSWPLSLPKCRRVIWLNCRRSVEIGVLWTANGEKNNDSSWVWKTTDLGGTCKKSPTNPMASPQEGPVWCFFGTFRWIQQILILITPPRMHGHWVIEHVVNIDHDTHWTSLNILRTGLPP